MLSYVKMKNQSLPNKWKWVKLGDVCAVTKLAGFEYTKYIALRAQNIRNTGLALNNIVKISENVASYLSRSKLFCGDVVMTFIGANIGEATWIDENDKYYCAPNIAKITPKSNLLNYHFLTRFIHSFSFQNQIRSINQSTAQQSLSMQNIRTFILYYPPLPEQKRIAAYLQAKLTEVERLKQTLQEQLDTINQLPAKLLSRAFRGEL